MQLQRFQIIVHGLVQGVGFRPHVYRTAKQLNLTGWVQNNASGVVIEIQGFLISEFLTQLKANVPVLAKIRDIQIHKIPLKEDEISFEINASKKGKVSTLISPDACICSDCLYELFDPTSRYFRYPFLNCMHCGPRLTITRHLPYDRCQTSMDTFPLCTQCHADYSNPDNRRYHAQPTACQNCGPQLSLPVDEIAKKILQGEIIALKGLGGYQLICDARNENTLLKLRERKHREAKPFALMVANLKSAEMIVEVSASAAALLKHLSRPILLLRKKSNRLPDIIASGLNYLGVMLPYTPLHYLLFNAFCENPNGCQWLEEVQSTILVVTSANPGGDPLVIEDNLASSVLEPIADRIIPYNRQIVTRADDSVMHIINDAPIFIRRARGFVPNPIQLPYDIPPTLALGGHLKNTFCITRGDEAFVSQHIGSLNNKATIEFFHESLNYFLKFLDVKPLRIAHDLHPNFYTTQFAEKQKIPAFAIQHHHAHLASVAAEHHIQDPVLGLVLDGYGYGLNGEAWGGELLLLENMTFKRLGCFAPLPQPGGDIAALEPWRMAASVLYLLGKREEIVKRFSNLPHAKFIHYLLEKRINSPMTSSCGRLFDAASALLGIQLISQYEGQAAMRLESLVTSPQVISNGWQIIENDFDIMPTLELISNNMEPITGANLFHGTLIAGLAAWVKRFCREKGFDTVLLSGGCFLNKILSEGLIKSLSESGIKPVLPRNLPPNDGGISLGQAWIAGRL